MSEPTATAITPSPVTMRVVRRLTDAIDNYPDIPPPIRALMEEAARELHQIAVDIAQHEAHRNGER